jgi:hypothetical protein
MLRFIRYLLDKATPYRDAGKEVTTAALSKRTFVEGLFLVRLEAEEAKRSYQVLMQGNWNYEVIPIAQNLSIRIWVKRLCERIEKERFKFEREAVSH